MPDEQCTGWFRADQTLQKNSDLEDIAVETIQNETEKRITKKI